MSDASFAEIVARLSEQLSVRLVAVMAGVRYGETVRDWAVGGSAPLVIQDRLRTADALSQMMLEYEGLDTVRAWWIGMNPELGDTSPAEAIRAYRLDDVRAAASAFLS